MWRHNHYPEAELKSDPINLYEVVEACSQELAFWIEPQVLEESTQEQRMANFTLVSGAIEKIIGKISSHDRHLVLKTGVRDIKAFSFGGSDGPYSRRRFDINAGTEITLKRSLKWTIDEIDRPEPIEFYRHSTEIYVGDSGRLIPMSTVARTLSEGGQLSLV